MRISVVIPTYNMAEYVCEAVESALSQTLAPIEVIVVDDGSTDDTRQRLKCYGGRILYLFQENAGLSAARNTGMRAARGDWIALLDSDDAFFPSKLEKQGELIRMKPSVRLVGCGGLLASVRPAMVEAGADQAALGGKPRRLTPAQIVCMCPFAPSSALVHRSLPDQQLLFDESLSAVEDLDYWLRVSESHEVWCLPDILMWQRMRPGSMSRDPERMRTNHERVLLRAFEQQSSLRNRRWIRGVAYARMHYSLTMIYREAGASAKALVHTFLTVLNNPFCYRGRPWLTLLRILVDWPRRRMLPGGEDG